MEKLKLRARAADNDFAIGSNLYSRMLATGEGLELPLERVASIGQANLEENLARLREVAASIAPDKSVQQIVDDISRTHPTAQGLIPDTRELLEDIRRALVDHDIISLPSEDRCQVIETPTYMRYAFAAMDSAGALETEATESFYYVTPVEDHWTPEQAEEWLSKFDYNTLRIISIHEVVPRSLRASPAQPLWPAPAAGKPGSHFLCVHRGLGSLHRADDAGNGLRRWQPELLLTQLLEALVRNCRYVCSVAMHTGDMTVDEATQFFMDNAFMAEYPSRREALRGTFDPGYLNYTLGKLMILKLRDDYRRERNGDYSLRGFHDRLLSYGAPPLPYSEKSCSQETARRCNCVQSR